MTEQGALFLHKAIVLPAWVDYNGHMSEAYYVLIFGDATDAFYDHAGLGAAYRRVANASVYTLESHIRYLSEVPEGENLSICTRVIGHDSKRLRLHHTMLRAADSSAVAVTEILAMHVEKPSLRSSAFPPHIREDLAALKTTPPVAAVSTHWQGGAA